MPDLKDRYSDPELNKANKDFEELVSTPDMQALDDRGEAIARDFGDTERNISEPHTISSSDSSGKNIKNAEKSPSDFGFYRPEPLKIRSRISGWSNRRKAAAAGAGGGIILTIVASMMALLPMKLIGIMDSIISETGQRVEQVTEKRAKTILARAILTKFGTHTGIVVTGEGAFSTLVASMRTSNFEKRLASKGLVIEQTRDGVKLRQNGKELGGGKELKNEKAILDALEKNSVSNKVLKQVIKEDIPSWRWMKRAKFAKWLRIKYGIPRYGILNNSDESDDKKRASAIMKERLKVSYDRVVANSINAFDCILGNECVAKNLGESTKGDLPDSDDRSTISSDIDSAGKSLVDESAKDPFKAVTKKLSSEILNKLGTKAIPIIGWIDLVATLDHIAYEAFQNDYFSKIPAYFRGLQYAQIFGEWSGYSDQQKLGALDHAANGPLANQLDGAEKAQAFNYIQGNASVGVPVKLKVNSNNPSEYQKFWKDYQDTMGTIPGTPGGKTTHGILNIYYETIGGGGLLGFLGDRLGAILGAFADFVTPEAVQAWLGEAVKKGLIKTMDYFGLTIDPLDKGADLFNNLHAGGTVSFNDYCREIGCRRLDPGQANLANQQIALERQADINDKGLFYALFSPENTQSLTTKFAMSLPSSGNASADDVVGKIASLVGSIPHQILTGITPNANAGTKYVDLYGIDPYGATEADLNKPLSQAFMEGDECPEVTEGAFNDCMIDNEVADAMVCDFKPDSAECIDTDQPAVSSTSGGGSQFRIASFNLETLKGPTDDWKTRLKTSVDYAKRNNFDIIGAQETEQAVQFNLAKTNKYFGAEYDVYPTEHMGESAASSRPIFYKRSRFEFVKGDQVAFKRMEKDFPGIRGNRKQPAYSPIVWLRDKATGQVFIVMNTHNSAYKFYADERYYAGIAYRDKIAQIRSENLPIIFTGDFNEGFVVHNSGPATTYQGKRENLNYCVLTANKLMKLALDELEGNSGTCPRTSDNGIDHIYISPEVQVTKYEKLAGGHSISGSDHRHVTMADIVIPGEGSLADMTVGTYNVKVPGQTDGPNDGWLHSSVRMPMIAEIIKEQGMEVVGFQEVENAPFKLLSDNLPEYDSHPKNPSEDKAGSSQNPVFWLKSRFDLVDKGEFGNSYRLCRGVELCNKSPWVRLRDKTSGKEFYYLSVHFVNENPYWPKAGTSDKLGAEKREASSREVIRTVKSDLEPGIPVFFVGDLNSSWKPADDDIALNGNRNRLPYCILTENNTLINSFDAVINKTGHCPTVNAPYEIDHIYVSPSLKIASAKQIRNEKTKKASDHDPVVAKVAADTGGKAVGDWSWPVDEKWWKSSRADFLSAHPSYSGTFTSPYQKGIAADIGTPPDGSPIYSMLSGKVVKTNLCGEKDGMIIESITAQGKLQIAYGHGTSPQFKVGDSVKSGQHILNLGAKGCKVNGGHLHVDMSLEGQHICPQDVFISMGAGKDPDLKALIPKVTPTCGRV